MHPFSTDFYGLQIRVIVLGYIRPEYNYTSLGEYPSSVPPSPRESQCAETVLLGATMLFYSITFKDALKDDIDMDKRVALNSVLPAEERPAWAKFKDDPFFFSEVQPASRLERSGAAGGQAAAVKGGAAL